MLHTARFFIKTLCSFFVMTTSCSLLGCSLLDIKPPLSDLKNPITPQKVYFANYDHVWRAAHAVIKFPISQENQDSGFIETEYIKGVDGWVPPGKTKSPSAGIRYKLIFNFAKGTTDGRDSTRVTVEKKIEILRNFFSTPESLESDGLEEKILFYRIERELIIAEALKKVN